MLIARHLLTTTSCFVIKTEQGPTVGAGGLDLVEAVSPDPVYTTESVLLERLFPLLRPNGDFRPTRVSASDLGFPLRT